MTNKYTKLVEFYRKQIAMIAYRLDKGCVKTMQIASTYEELAEYENKLRIAMKLEEVENDRIFIETFG